MQKLLISLVLSLFATVTLAETPLYTQQTTSIQVSSDKAEFNLKLKSNPTTGYSWYLVNYDTKLVKAVKHSYQAPTSQLVGASGYDVWTFDMLPAAFTVPQRTAISLVYARPWQAEASDTAVNFIVSSH